MSPNETLLRELYRALETSSDAAEIAQYWHPDAEQIEYPSAMRPTGHRRPLEEMLIGFERGARLLTEQRYDVRTVIDAGDRAAVELTWRARTSADLAGVPAGAQLTAHVALFYEFRDGLVLRQSSYDCYEPLPA